MKPQLQQQQVLLNELRAQQTRLATEETSITESLALERKSSYGDLEKYNDYVRYAKNANNKLQDIRLQQEDLQIAIEHTQEKLLELYSDEQRYLKYIENKQKEIATATAKKEQQRLDEIATRKNASNN